MNMNTQTAQTNHTEDRPSRLQECEIAPGPINSLLFQVLSPAVHRFQSQFWKHAPSGVCSIRRLCTGELTPSHVGIFIATAHRVSGAKCQGESEMARSKDFVALPHCLLCRQTPVAVPKEKPWQRVVLNYLALNKVR